jgi:hypothetical protein
MEVGFKLQEHSVDESPLVGVAGQWRVYLPAQTHFVMTPAPWKDDDPIFAVEFKEKSKSTGTKFNTAWAAQCVDYANSMWDAPMSQRLRVSTCPGVTEVFEGQRELAMDNPAHYMSRLLWQLGRTQRADPKLSGLDGPTAPALGLHLSSIHHGPLAISMASRLSRPLHCWRAAMIEAGPRAKCRTISPKPRQFRPNRDNFSQTATILPNRVP